MTTTSTHEQDTERARAACPAEAHPQPLGGTDPNTHGRRVSGLRLLMSVGSTPDTAPISFLKH